MSSTKTDIDLSGITIIRSPPKNRCPKHGPHDAALYVTITNSDGELALTRAYCMHCYVEHLDKFGVREMEPIPST